MAFSGSDFELPSRGNSPFAVKYFSSEGNQNSLSRLLGEPDETYTIFKKPIIGNSAVVVAFDHPFDFVAVYVKVDEPIRMTGYASDGFVTLNKTKNTSKIIAGWLADESKSRSGIISTPGPDFYPECAVEAVFNTGYSKDGVFILEIEGDVRIDGFAIEPWASSGDYVCSFSN